ncbi:hypothetical protein BJ170DRAFT_110032 [Xylariales sp. AK1849]|nr:hypothetical protein BJ170DRAFT_110032 [Xylariales sp. AK1849]
MHGMPSDLCILITALFSRNAKLGLGEEPHLHQLNVVKAPNVVLSIDDSRFDELGRFPSDEDTETRRKCRQQEQSSASISKSNVYQKERVQAVAT